MENKNIEVTTNVEGFSPEIQASMLNDDFCQLFPAGAEGQMAMQNFLTLEHNNSSWHKVKINTIRVKALPDGPIMIPVYLEEYNIHNVTEDALRSVVCDGKEMGETRGSCFMAQIPEINGDSRYYLLSIPGLAGATSRAGVDCAAFNRFSLSFQEKVMNTGFETTGEAKTGYVKLLDSKVVTINGAMYVIFNNSRTFDSILDMLEERFPGAVFQGGSYSHDRIEASWTMPKQADELLSVYQKALEKSETRMDFSGFVPSIRFFTSDIGDSSAYIDAVLQRGANFAIKIGTPIKVEHKGIESEQQFIDKLDDLYAQFKNTAEGLAKLADIKIANPVNTMLNIAFGTTIKLGKKATLDAIERFKLCCPENEKCTAADVFYVLEEALYNMRTSENTVSETTIANVEESLMRLLNPAFPWDEYDTTVLLSTIQVKLD